MANLDMRDIMMDRGFWGRVGSGGMPYGLLDGRLPGSDIGPLGPLAVELGGGAEDGAFPPAYGKKHGIGVASFGLCQNMFKKHQHKSKHAWVILKKLRESVDRLDWHYEPHQTITRLERDYYCRA